MFEFKTIPMSDLDTYFDLMNDKSIAVNAGSVPHPITREWAKERLLASEEGEAQGRRADRGLYEDGVLVGTSGYFYQDNGLEIGYCVHRDHRSRGHATRAAKLAVKLARDHRRTGPVYAGYFQDNPVSGKILEKVNFKLVGENISHSLGRPGEDIPGYHAVLTGDLAISPLHENDYDVLFAFQNDEDAHRLAAGGTVYKDIEVYRAFLEKAQQKGAIFRAILLEGRPVGYIATFDRDEKREITYWLGREFWGQGIASKAVDLWLKEIGVPENGLYARVAKDHAASARVLEKSGFNPVGSDSYFSDARRETVDETIYLIEKPAP